MTTQTHHQSPFLDITLASGRTDIANARRFAETNEADLRYCHAWKKWLVWDGTRWKVDDVGTAHSLATLVCDLIWMEARRHNHPDAIEWAAKSAFGPRVNAMVDLAKNDTTLVVRPGQLDQAPWVLNCPNGTLDLQTGELRPHDRADLITQLCPTDYHPDADTEVWDRFVSSIFAGDQDLIGFVKRHAGYCLTGDVREQLMMIAWGDGSNGKSTYLNALMDTIGDNYAMQGAPDMLMQQDNKGHSTERMDLFGRRLVSCSETDETAKLNESFIKLLTGGEKIRGRRVYENNWEFDPTHKLVLCTNHKPQVKGTDHAIWRRIRLVPFTVRFWNPDDGDDGPEELRQDKALAKRLQKSRRGILRWCVEGCAEWLEHGLAMPTAVKDATNEYRSREDIVGEFLHGCTLATEAGRVTFKDLYDRFSDYCDETGLNRPSRRFLSTYLGSHGYDVNRTGGTTRIGGIAIVDGHAHSW